MIKRSLSLSSLGLLLLTVMPILGEAAAPNYIGIPQPSFGIDETAPADPPGWPSNEVAGYYYIEQAHPSASDSNQYGSPSAPRYSIPNALPAGSVVTIVGMYQYDHESGIVASGTREAPVFIRGSAQRVPAIFDGKWVVRGSYYIIENIEGAWRSGNSQTGRLNFHGDHGVVRNGKFHGDRGRVGVGSVNVSGSNMLLYRNEIYDSGLLTTDVDADTHGTRVMPNSQYIWILANIYHHNSGDGIQINAENEANQASLHHVFVAGNIFYENRQTGAWTKQAEHVIFSQNESYGHLPDVGGAGTGLGAQYAAEYVWFIFNDVHDNGGGIRIASDSGLGHGQNHYVIGNKIYNNRATTGNDPENPWALSAISIWGGRNTVITANTLANNAGGIYSPRGSGTITITSNLFADDNAGYAYNLEFQNILTEPANNFFQNGQRVKLGNQSYTLSDYFSRGLEMGSIRADDPQFRNAASGDFSVTDSSVVIDAGAELDAYELFRSLYGVSIRMDIQGAPRPTSDKWDIGAIENNDVIRPDAPGNLE